jgi:hypothetical protein
MQQNASAKTVMIYQHVCLPTPILTYRLHPCMDVYFACPNEVASLSNYPITFYVDQRDAMEIIVLKELQRCCL